MLLSSLLLTLLLSTLVAALPLDNGSKPQHLVPRVKSYAIVNVDGGSTTEPSPEPTTVVDDKTKTIRVTDAAPTKTGEATTTVAPAPVPTSSSSACTSSTSSPISTPQPSSTPTAHPSETPVPSVVTVTVSEPTGTTEYYDNGLWHTSYAIKTFEQVVATSSSSEVISTATSSIFSSQPALPTLSLSSYNQTEGPW